MYSVKILRGVNLTICIKEKYMIVIIRSDYAAKIKEQKAKDNVIEKKQVCYRFVFSSAELHTLYPNCK